ncbi:substrate-binding domain-containing protein [Plantactinospora sp. BC1]|uniref:substrate-binding domain-containing protein n=1 Tax=Plantactinospora sp. BC1 TaxID=2108470 RepID=UPI001F22C9B1|nr:substrate-binding domain-containing protein [Plantactinospora sp. BC1]
MRRRSPRVGAIAVAVAVVAVMSGVSVGYQQLARSGCTGQVTLTVAATPEIAGAVRSAVSAWDQRDTDAGAPCVRVAVSEAEPADVAAALAGTYGVGLAGVGQSGAVTAVPDVWVPDSSTWLLRLSSAAPGFRPTDGASIARSPVVVAMPEPVASGLGWPHETPTLAELVQRITTGVGLRSGIVEPTRDAAGLSGLMAFGATAGTGGAAARRASTAVVRSLATRPSVLRDDLLAQFPRSTVAGEVSSGLSLAVLSEEDVIAYNADRPPVPLAALYVDPAPMPLDYPFAVLAGTDPAKAAAADGLRQALATARFRNDLARQGLRAADGTWGAGFPAPAGAPSPSAAPASAAPGTGAAPGAPADPAVVDRALAAWSAITAPGRMLAAIDVSGSMRDPVPTAGDISRMQVTLLAAENGLALFNDDWAVGLWTFSRQLDGARDYRELVPVGPLSAQRGALRDALAEITPKRNGGTGLYDTVLAAYRQMRNGWQPGRVNSVVILTDGVGNDDRDGLSLEALLGQLERLKDENRPVQVIVVGIGDAVDRASLERITKTTGGGVLVTEDPAKIGDVFLKAIALRSAPG